MEREELDELIEEPFKVPDLAQLWPEMLRHHTDMGFRIPLTDDEKGGVLTDNEMIQEFQWIYGQYKKYIGTKKKAWLAMKGELPKLIDTIKDTLEKESVTPKNRSELIYQTMRNQWLLNAWNHYAFVIEMLEEPEEGEDIV